MIPEVIVEDETGRSLRPHKEQYICIVVRFMLDPHHKTLLGFSITNGRSALELSACLLSVTGSNAGAPNPLSLSLMLVSGILS